MTKIEKVAEISKEEVELQHRALLEMYQAGFLDGYNAFSRKKGILTKTIKKLCIKSFDKRFMSKIKK